MPLKMFVNLTTSDNPSFEIAPTVDISCHGARVVTARFRRVSPFHADAGRRVAGTGVDSVASVLSVHGWCLLYHRVCSP